MKHLKRKFLKVAKVGDDVIGVLQSAPVNETAIAEIKNKGYEGYYAIMQTEGNELIQAFQYNNNGHACFIPEPNPIVIYFELARFHLGHLKTKKISLLKEIHSEKPNAYTLLDEFHGYYSVASICGTFLFNAIEAFINKLIPKDYSYKRIQESKTEIFNKIQIQRNISFEEKIKKVIPDATEKIFHVTYGAKFESIIRLKDFRDEIMHTKSNEHTSANLYKTLYTTSLDFDYDKTLEDVKDYINFYEANLIEECSCNNNY